MNYILEYWQQIESGKVIVSARVRKQYKKLAERIKKPEGRYIFDEKRANRPIEFTETLCKQSRGEWGGRKMELELFQKAFISALFGFIDKETRLRQYRETMFYIGRKNGKSTLLACIALYMLTADHEAGAEVYSVATKRDQAKIIFNEAYNMVQQSPALRKALKKRKADLYFPTTFSRFEALSKDSGSLDGLNSHCVIIDELHGIKDRNLYEVMKQSQSARQQPLLIMITTAGTIRECIFDDMYTYSMERRVNEEKLPYDKWYERGLVRLCKGNTINYKDVTAWFVEMANTYGIFPAWIYYDRWSATYWVEEMKATGFTEMKGVAQGAKTLSLPMQFLGADLQAKKINYNNNPVLRWCLSNTGVQEDRNGNIVPIKNQAAKQRIDGTASLLNAYVGLYEHYNEFIEAQ